MKKQLILLYIGLLTSAAPLLSADHDPNIVWPASKPTLPIPMLSVEEQFPATVPLLLEEMQRTSIANIEQRAEYVRNKARQLTAKDDDPDFEKKSWCDQRTDVFHTIYKPIFVRLEQHFDTTMKTPIALHILELVQQQEAFNAGNGGVKREENKVELTFPSNQRLDEYTRYTLNNSSVHCVTKITDSYLILAAIELAKKAADQKPTNEKPSVVLRQVSEEYSFGTVEQESADKFQWGSPWQPSDKLVAEYSKPAEPETVITHLPGKNSSRPKWQKFGDKIEADPVLAAANRAEEPQDCITTLPMRSISDENYEWQWGQEIDPDPEIANAIAAREGQPIIKFPVANIAVRRQWGRGIEPNPELVQEILKRGVQQGFTSLPLANEGPSLSWADIKMATPAQEQITQEVRPFVWGEAKLPSQKIVDEFDAKAKNGPQRGVVSMQIEPTAVTSNTPSLQWQNGGEPSQAMTAKFDAQAKKGPQRGIASLPTEPSSSNQ